MRFLLIALLCALSYAQTVCGPGTKFCGPLNTCVLVGSDTFAEQCASELDAADWAQYNAGVASTNQISAGGASASTSPNAASQCTYPMMYCLPMQRCMNINDANFNDYCEVDNDMPLIYASGSFGTSSSSNTASGSPGASTTTTTGTTSNSGSSASSSSGTGCTFPMVVCHRMGGICMDSRHPDFNDNCELDNDMFQPVYFANGGASGAATGMASCTSPEIPCPRTGGCMNPMAPKFNDMCELDNDYMYPGIISVAGASGTTGGSSSTTTGSSASTTSTGTSDSTTTTGTSDSTTTTTTGTSSSSTTTTTTGTSSANTGTSSTTTTTTTGTSSTTSSGTGSSSTSTGSSTTTTGSDSTSTGASTTTTGSSTATGSSTPVTCVFPQVPCPRTGGCFSSLMADAYEDACEIDGDVPYIVSAGTSPGSIGVSVGVPGSSSCTAPEIPCPRTGGCMNPMSQNFGDLCEPDGDYWVPMSNSAGCNAPQVYCPATGGCMDQYSPNYNDMCERLLQKKPSVKEAGYSTLQLVGIASLGFAFGVIGFCTFDYCRKRRTQENQEILLEATV